MYANTIQPTNRMFSPQLLDAVRRSEAPGGVPVLKAYWDNIGKCWTIAFGHTGPDVDESTECTPDEAESWLESDLTHSTANAQRLPEWPHLDTPARQDAVTELVFNMGYSRWLGFKKTRSDLIGEDFPTAGAELVNSDWAGEVGPERAGRLRSWIATGQYQ